MRVKQRQQAHHRMDSRHHRKGGTFCHPQEGHVLRMSCFYSDIILVDYQQTNPATPVLDKKMALHTSVAQPHFAVIVPITPFCRGRKGICSPQQTSNQATPVKDNKITQQPFSVIVPITRSCLTKVITGSSPSVTFKEPEQYGEKEECNDKKMDAVAPDHGESQSRRFEDFRHYEPARKEDEREENVEAQGDTRTMTSSAIAEESATSSACSIYQSCGVSFVEGTCASASNSTDIRFRQEKDECNDQNNVESDGDHGPANPHEEKAGGDTVDEMDDGAGKANLGEAHVQEMVVKEKVDSDLPLYIEVCTTNAYAHLCFFCLLSCCS
jgi:hypothetical protein